MNKPSATKQYVVNQLPTTSGDITSHTFTETASGIGTGATWHYRKTGKLYFDFWVASGGGGSNLQVGATSLQSQTNTTLDHLASLIGVTVNTYYSSTNVDTARCIYWTGSAYTSPLASPGTAYMGTGFLSN